MSAIVSREHSKVGEEDRSLGSFERGKVGKIGQEREGCGLVRKRNFFQGNPEEDSDETRTTSQNRGKERKAPRMGGEEYG